ncbi:transposase [Streptomyces violaceus]|uniref:transposase n=1 Tax=Streptomyces violaceus TaxID=1936 RepID=UPI0038B60D99
MSRRRPASARSCPLIQPEVPEKSPGLPVPADALSALGAPSWSFKDHQVVDHRGVIRRHEITDPQWELLAPVISRAVTGRPRVADRQVVNGMVYTSRTGISWRDLPERYGP